MSYKPHEPLIALARASSALWRLGVGMILLVVVVVLFSMAMFTVQNAVLSPQAHSEWNQALTGATTPLSVLVNLYSFGFLIAALGVSLHLVHRRGLWGLLGPVPLAVVQFWRVSKALVLIYLLVLLLPAPEPLQVAPNLDFSLWIMLLPVALVGLLIQTSAEELVFRGYLQSQLAARFRHPLIWIGLPSVLFAALHFNSQIDETSGWLIVLWALVFAVATADLTARSGTLGPAIALHFINNISAIAIAAPEGSFDGLALYSYPFSLSDSQIMLSWMPVEMLIMLCSWLAARIALRV